MFAGLFEEPGTKRGGQGDLEELRPVDRIGRQCLRPSAAHPPFRPDSFVRSSLELVRGRILAAAALLAAASWAITGTAAWILIAALTPSPPDPFFLIGAYAFAWLVGFLVVFAPSGLGVREATLIVLLAPHLGAGPATVLAVVLRFANIVGDVVAAGAVEAAASTCAGHRPPRANAFEHPARID